MYGACVRDGVAVVSFLVGDVDSVNVCWLVLFMNVGGVGCCLFFTTATLFATYTSSLLRMRRATDPRLRRMLGLESVSCRSLTKMLSGVSGARRAVVLRRNSRL